ncbi:MAG: ChaN family lipoprotein [Aquificota bacterium]|nr:ChaN family lipoprotein [Aquificota bacterium]
MVFALLLTGFVFAGEFIFFKRTTLDEIITHMERARVIYLGEVHDSEEAHRLQLYVIRTLVERGHRIIIAMEMFQQQFQEYLDDYVEGIIDEEEMLGLTEYRERWRFDPELYAPIWRFARENRIRLFALNIPSELIREVREKGIENVKSGYLPPRIVLTTKEYEEFLRKAMEKHQGVDEKRFFDVQLAWDNGMAYRIAKLLAGNPDHKIVVLVGSGHVWRGYGIPERVNHFLGEVPQAVLYMDGDEAYFLFSKDFSRETSSANSMSEPN